VRYAVVSDVHGNLEALSAVLADAASEGALGILCLGDAVGYGADPPDPQWPGGARIAVNINVNFEGGGERSILEGDDVSEGALNDIGQPSLPGLRSPLVESVFEYPIEEAVLTALGFEQTRAHHRRERQ